MSKSSCLDLKWIMIADQVKHHGADYGNVAPRTHPSRDKMGKLDDREGRDFIKFWAN